MKIAIGCDHAAFDVKEQLKIFLSDELNHQVLDLQLPHENVLHFGID